ncbi:hypothetical protein ABKN59_009419 [Abortiporus biennis]
MKLQGFEAVITCEGHRLQEFQTTVEDGRTISCFVPSMAGKNFEVIWKDHTYRGFATVRMTVDGRKVNGKINYPGNRGKRKGIRSSVDTLQPFQFSEVVLRDDDNLVTSSATLEQIGSIAVNMTAILPPRSRDFGGFTASRFEDIGPVNERSKKAGSHCISLGQPQRCEAKRRTHVRIVNPHQGPIAVFVFRYRPAGVLQARGIASADQLSQLLPIDNWQREHRPHSSLSHRNRSLTFRSDDAKPNIVGHTPVIKKEDNHHPVRYGEIIDLTQIKDEEDSLPIRTGFIPGEVVDLTLDDD